jgi:hypothetical protein
MVVEFATVTKVVTGLGWKEKPENKDDATSNEKATVTAKGTLRQPELMATA